MQMAMRAIYQYGIRVIKLPLNFVLRALSTANH